ncbi:UNVERIFIED_CONTAM: hypothetical protein K2H54_067133 [Gekko kuhli]
MKCLVIDLWFRVLRPLRRLSDITDRCAPSFFDGVSQEMEKQTLNFSFSGRVPFPCVDDPSFRDNSQNHTYARKDSADLLQHWPGLSVVVWDVVHAEFCLNLKTEATNRCTKSVNVTDHSSYPARP